MTVYKTRAGVWYVECRTGIPGDKKGRTKIYCGKDEQKARELHTSLGLDKTTRAAARLGPTVMDCLSGYMAARYGRMAMSTAMSADYRIQTRIEPFFRGLSVYHLDRNIMDRYVVQRLQDVKASTVRRELVILKAATAWALDTGLTVSDPIRNYKLPEADTARISPPSQAELKMILAHAAPHLRRVILLGYYLGCRIGKEVFGIRWADYDAINKRLTIHAAKKGKESLRDVPVHPILEKCLLSWLKEDRQRKVVPEYIVHYHGRRIDKLRNSWKNALQRAGITRKLTPYSLRHASITGMLEAGSDLKGVSEIAGHSSTRMTTMVYQHTSESIRRKAVDSLPDILPE